VNLFQNLHEQRTSWWLEHIEHLLDILANTSRLREWCSFFFWCRMSTISKVTQQLLCNLLLAAHTILLVWWPASPNLCVENVVHCEVDIFIFLVVLALIFFVNHHLLLDNI
jgi:hypothetical protein